MPAVLIAVYIVKQLDPFYVRWGVVVVVVYTAVAMLRSAMKESRVSDAAGIAPSPMPAEDR